MGVGMGLGVLGLRVIVDVVDVVDAECIETAESSSRIRRENSWESGTLVPRSFAWAAKSKSSPGFNGPA